MFPPIIWYFLRPYRLFYGGILLVILAASVLESLGLAALFPLLSSILDSSSQVARKGILGMVVSLVQLIPFDDLLVSSCVVIIGITFLKSAVLLLRETLTAYVSGKVLYGVKNRLMEKYADSPYQFFLDNKQGALIYESQMAPHKVCHLLLKAPQFVAELFKVIAIMIILFTVSGPMTLGLAVLGLAYYGLALWLSRRVSYHLGKGRADAATRQNIIVNEFFNGLRQIKAFCTTRRWLQFFEKENRVYCTLYAKDLLWLAVPKNLMELTAISAVFGSAIVFRVYGHGEFASQLPALGVFAVSLVQILPALTSCGRIRMEVMGCVADTEVVYHALTSSVSPARSGKLVFGSLGDAIVFEGVFFSHKGREPLLKDINVAFEKGNVTAIVGPTGVGKSTAVNLLLGLFEPSSGRILVDGLPLSDYQLESWLSKVGFVSQDPFIYHSTVLDNIVFGRHGYSKEDVIEAAKIANAHQFISELPQGYETIVGERGMKLSGGQQQRICIARAILGKPEILIFDEATSSLDSISEALIQKTIAHISRRYTVIMIAHRPSTIVNADKIVVLDEGKIVEQGRHAELLNNHGRYSRLMMSNLS